jgi:hypothetical protein
LFSHSRLRLPQRYGTDRALPSEADFPDYEENTGKIIPAIAEKFIGYIPIFHARMPCSYAGKINCHSQRIEKRKNREGRSH